MADVAITSAGLGQIRGVVDGLLRAVPILFGKTDVPDALAEDVGLLVAFEVDGCRAVVAVRDGEPVVVVLSEVDGG